MLLPPGRAKSVTELALTVVGLLDIASEAIRFGNDIDRLCCTRMLEATRAFVPFGLPAQIHWWSFVKRLSDVSSSSPSLPEALEHIARPGNDVACRFVETTEAIRQLPDCASLAGVTLFATPSLRDFPTLLMDDPCIWHCVIPSLLVR